MSINDNDSRVRRTKKLIRQGLTELAKEKSITKITVKELTDLIEINRGTFYLHYKDIFDLVECLEAELYQEFEKIISSITIDAVKESPIDELERICVFVKKNADLVGTLVGEHGDAQFVNKIGDLTNKTVLTLFEEIYPDMNRQRYDFAYEYCKYGTMGLIYAWLTKHPETSTRSIAEMWAKLLAQGIMGVIDMRAVKEFTK